EPFTSRLSGFDVHTAYEVAHMIHQARLEAGEVPVGRKIWFTNPEMLTLYEVSEPMWAYIYDTTVVRLSGNIGVCSIGRFADPKIEPEIVVHFGSTPSVDADPSAILECIDWIAHAFEIVQSHFPDWKFQAPDTVADSGLHGMLLVGEPQPVDRLAPDLITALERFSIALSCEGKLCEVGRGSNVLGSPLAAVAHLIAVLAKQPRYAPLQAGEMVSTGTLTAALSVHAGETWSTELRGIALPGLSVKLIA
ncbi:MAG: fumarylacetoacetate hydrolase family protein, partial [Anaerolineae bacterium]|nr:fumarylacetoacetate hydrolase family protein [Phycisphaerae bacterium]